MSKGIAKSAWLAWGGWQMRVPEDWRPLKIEGDSRRGAMLIGTADAALVQVKWSQPDRRKFDPKAWVRRRLGANESRKAVAADPPGSGSQAMRVLAWVPSVPNAKDAKGAAQSLWYGYSPAAELLIEMVINSQDRPGVQSAMVDRVLPSLRVRDRSSGSPTNWAIFQASFRTPPGLDVIQRRLHAGHICLLFGPSADQQGRARRGCRLLLRQIYPAELALARKDLLAWLRLDAPGGPQRRRFCPVGEPEEWSVESPGRAGGGSQGSKGSKGSRLTGLIRRGFKRLPAPLGRVSPRFSVSAVARDADLDRLLLAEYDSPADPGDAPVTDAIAAMNWAIWESG